MYKIKVFKVEDEVDLIIGLKFNHLANYEYHYIICNNNLIKTFGLKLWLFLKLLRGLDIISSHRFKIFYK